MSLALLICMLWEKWRHFNKQVNISQITTKLSRLSRQSKQEPFRLKVTTPDTCYLFEERQKVEVRGEPSEATRFLNWISGYHECALCKLHLVENGCEYNAGSEARQKSVVRLNKPGFGKSLHETIFFQMEQNCKEELFRLIDEHYGPELKSRTNPLNPLFDTAGNPISIASLSARSLLEISQINLLLKKPKIIIINHASGLLTKALSQGFRIHKDLLELNSIFFIHGNSPTQPAIECEYAITLNMASKNKV